MVKFTIPKIPKEKIATVAEILKTIGHPIRLDILQVLSSQEALCVSDILSALDHNVEQSLLSHHLIKLKDKGILIAQRSGMHRMYKISDKRILKIFDCIDKCEF